MRFIGAGIATALCVAFCALLPTPVSASGETYAWSDYAAIEGYGGSFTDITKETSDQAAFTFGQTEGDPNVFVFSIQVEGKCNGQITITLSDTEPGKGKLTSSGDCPVYSGMDKDITISRSELVKEKVTQEGTSLYNAYERKTCNPEQMAQAELNAPAVGQPASYSECINNAKQSYKAAQEECSNTQDYEKFPQRANPYLDCIAEKLEVEREGNEATPEEEEEEAATCSIPDIGWMMCQVLQFVSWITDQAFNILSSMLEVEPLQEQVNGQDSRLYAAWKVSLTFANVVFVFAFIFMILSYVTSWGIGAYGIKKLVPRMIIAAFLVNLSFFLCGVAVDLSNILGGTLKNTLVEMTPPSSGSPNYENWSRVTETVVAITPNDADYTADNQPGADNSAPADPNAAPAEPDPAASGTDPEEEDLWPPMTEVLLGGLLLTGGAVLWANLSALVPFMAAALVAIITVLIVLIIRQAVIIILIAIAPIAISLYILPNTKQWLDRWFDIFSKFLLIYPAVALVFGASYFASRVILDQASENGQTFLAMFALGIQVIPLFITPVIMKFGAGVLDRFGGIVNNPNKGPLDAIKRKAGEFREDRKNQQLGRAASGATAEGKGLKNFLRNPNAARQRRNMKRDAGDAAIDAALSRSKKIAANTPDAIRSAASGVKPGEFYDSLVEESLADAAKELDDIKVGRIHAAEARFKQDSSLDEDALHDMALSGKGKNGEDLTDIERAAAVQMAANTATSEQAHKLILASGDMDKALRRILVDNLRKSGFTKQNAHFGGSAMNAVVEGRINSQDDVNELVRRAAEGGKYSSTAIASQSSYALGLVNSALDTEGHLSGAASERIMQNAHNALSTPSIEKGINTNSRAGVERLAR